MNITLYKNTSENERVDKSLTSSLSITGTLRDKTDVINPVVLIEIDNPSQLNYAYIDDFHRYYYINEITSVRKGLWSLSMHVDVLMTYRDAIKNQNAIIRKQYNTKYTSENYNDGSFRTKEENFTEIWNFDEGFNDTGEFILLTAGAISGGN